MAFLIGCSFTFERALLAEGLPVRHIEQGVNVPMYRTDRACRPAGRFAGPLVVSMRPMAPAEAIRAAEITARYPPSTGRRCTSATPPGSASRTSGRPTTVTRSSSATASCRCSGPGVTPQAVAAASRPELMITHAPGRMFVTDTPDGELAML